MLAPGERTRKFRLGTERLLVDGKGESKISIEDYAVAMVDELESPRIPAGDLQSTTDREPQR